MSDLMAEEEAQFGGVVQDAFQGIGEQDDDFFAGELEGECVDAALIDDDDFGHGGDAVLVADGFERLGNFGELASGGGGAQGLELFDVVLGEQPVDQPRDGINEQQRSH